MYRCKGPMEKSVQGLPHGKTCEEKIDSKTGALKFMWILSHLPILHMDGHGPGSLQPRPTTQLRQVQRFILQPVTFRICTMCTLCTLRYKSTESFWLQLGNELKSGWTNMWGENRLHYTTQARQVQRFSQQPGTFRMCTFSVIKEVLSYNGAINISTTAIVFEGYPNNTPIFTLLWRRLSHELIL